MSNPFSGTEIPGMNAMGDTLSFVKKLWGSMQVPGMVAPPMSLDELDKKIQDLKTVESWLTVNMNMLRGTIQALEVQRATIAALQSLGESFAQHAQQAGAMAEQAAANFGAAGNTHADGSSATTSNTKASTSHADWPMHPATTKEPEPDPDEEVDELADDMPPETLASATSQEEEKPEAQPAENPVQSDASAQFVNPAAWWGLLQEQFKQAVSKAMEGEPPGIKADDSAAPVAAPTPKSRPVAKTSKTKAATSTRTAKPTTASKAKATTTSKPLAKSGKPAATAGAKATGKATNKATSKATSKTTGTASGK
ncbi:PhaM family polyhydroxyalkanoate granule multifunctional regulatory protein [Undibacterium sp. Di26W]|uniref:PhaM family polyhydroxyalkanoate granule multifunctional regulatory protein n=1 Tax=Undibacterium sp. Di26W TaxID=3413035 RepID=UPI003BEF77B4